MKPITKKIKITLLIMTAMFSLSVITSCSVIERGNQSHSDSSISVPREVVENYLNIGYANYVEALEDAVALRQAIGTFNHAPTEANFSNARAIWLKARESYGQSEAFRYAGGPIDNEDGYEATEGQLNAWPLDESHIDYVMGNATTGLINDTTFTLSKTSIIGKNEEGGEETKVSTGFHAIEFLLWGQDLSPGAGAGQRAYTDYTTAANKDRRQQYLSLVAEIIVDDLTYFTNQWGENGSYRSNLLASGGEEFLESILTSLGKMSKGELGAERIGAALTSRDKEDEHSCFSDNTHRDVYLNALGLLNVYLGQYTDAEGQRIGSTNDGLYSFLLSLEATKANELKTFLETAVTKSGEASALAEGGEPFDQLIKTGNANRSLLEQIMSALTSAGDKIVELGRALLGKQLSTSV